MALDGKGRLAIPTRHRDVIMQRCGGSLVVTMDPDGCLLLYPFPDWEPIEQRLNKLPSFNPVSREMQRLLVGSASDVEMDGTGRILLPATHRSYAKLDKDAMLVGQGHKFEIWNAAAWEARFAGISQLPGKLDEALKNGDMPDDLRDFTL